MIKSFKSSLLFRWIAVILGLSVFHAHGANIITATVVVTNAANLNGTNAASLTLSSSIRIATNSVITPATQWKASTNTATAAFNLLQHLRTYQFTGVQTSATNNGVVLTGAEGAALSLTVSNSWASVAYRTNAVGTSYGVISVPYSIFDAMAQNRLSDGLVSWLNIAPTNAITATAPVAANLVGLPNAQTIAGAKNMTNTGNVFVGTHSGGGSGLTGVIDATAVHLAGSETVSGAKNMTNTGNVFVGTLSGSGSGITGVVDATAVHLAGTETVTGAKSLTNQANVIVGATLQSIGAATVGTSLNLGTYLQQAHSALTADSAVTNFVADFTGLPYRTITAAAAVNFIQSTNRAAVRSMVIFVDANGANRTLSVNASWKKLNAFDTTITNGTVGVLSLTTKGTSESDVYAAYAVTQ